MQDRDSPDLDDAATFSLFKRNMRHTHLLVEPNCARPQRMAQRRHGGTCDAYVILLVRR